VPFTKEIIVEAWPLIESFSGLIRPVDSEHSALWRIGAKEPGVKSIYVVGSGGSLRDRKREEIENATLDQVLSHPVWNMGPRSRSILLFSLTNPWRLSKRLTCST